MIISIQTIQITHNMIQLLQLQLLIMEVNITFNSGKSN